jgi:hypothetical protein
MMNGYEIMNGSKKNAGDERAALTRTLSRLLQPEGWVGVHDGCGMRASGLRARVTTRPALPGAGVAAPSKGQRTDMLSVYRTAWLM